MAFITKKHLSRRTFLKGAGVVVALPLLDSMVPALAAGHAVVATGRNTDAVARALGDAPDLLVVKLDVTRPADAKAAVAAAVERFGRIDVLVNNAGFGADRTVEDTTAEEFRAMLEGMADSIDAARAGSGDGPRPGVKERRPDGRSAEVDGQDGRLGAAAFHREE